jgi:hypothetical protein
VSPPTPSFLGSSAVPKYGCFPWADRDPGFRLATSLRFRLGCPSGIAACRSPLSSPRPRYRYLRCVPFRFPVARRLRLAGLLPESGSGSGFRLAPHASSLARPRLPLLVRSRSLRTVGIFSASAVSGSLPRCRGPLPATQKRCQLRPSRASTNRLWITRISGIRLRGAGTAGSAHRGTEPLRAR